MSGVGRRVVAKDTQYEKEFEKLAHEIMAGNSPECCEIDWLSVFVMDRFSGDFDDIVYAYDSLGDQFFTDDSVLDADAAGDPDRITDADRLRFGRNFLKTLGEEDLDTYSMFDPAVFDFDVVLKDGESVTLVIGFCCLGGHGVMEYDLLCGYRAKDFYEELERVGYMTAEALREKSDEWILDQWDQRDRA